MPLMPKVLRQCAAFLYTSEVDARKDNGFLAMGFLVGMMSRKKPGLMYHYVVTNEHVVQGRKTVTVRLNKAIGFQIVTIAASGFSLDAKHDLAAAPISLVQESQPRLEPSCAYVDAGMMLNDFNADNYALKIGAGDEVCMVSRLVRAKMKYLTQNIPLMRFGSVALCPMHEEQSFFVEMRSIPGHSGSPVFVYSLPFAIGTNRSNPNFGFRLLGVNVGHLRELEPVVSFDASGNEQPHSRWFAGTSMAISQVTPAWHLKELLTTGKLLDQREQVEAAIPSAGAELVKDARKPGKKIFRP